MAPLLTIRIDNTMPWTTVGVDYLGPLNSLHDCIKTEIIKNWTHPSSRKIWLVLFTCFRTRAIHLEIARSCATVDFLEAFRRFVGHCGRPLKFYSDNATNFKKANAHLKKLFANVKFDKIKKEKFKGDCPIQWELSKPEGPWTNGVTERIIGIFKRQFRIAAQKSKLTMRQIETLIIELISIINDRPLGSIDQDPTASSAITPNLLIHGRQKGQIITPKELVLSTLPY
ncbi:uncharacterized protein [Lepeophtheirus salmonis]|uniref:uncharacterized protein n=1 Tax=Lepeophtheirus salmonis TaxID=72036 RepID=UPI001AEAA959|nr:uncharacterized protein LOC121131643 [Lepeophtheirus salmonis]